MLRLAGTRNSLRAFNTLRSVQCASASTIADLVPPPIGSSDTSSEHTPRPSDPNPPPTGASSNPSTEHATSASLLSTTEPPILSGVPAAPTRPTSEHIPPIIPFDTHRFYKILEDAFEPPIARTLMKATRGLLVDRIRQTTKDALHLKDFDNVIAFPTRPDRFVLKPS
jgi:hypothetical protein